jgi:predicted nuclease of restriction endonuclease-like (RecB) superfamily
MQPLFPLPWSHCVRLLTVADLVARKYYEGEALQGGWSVRQLDSTRITATFFEFLHDSATVALATKL